MKLIAKFTFNFMMMDKIDQKCRIIISRSNDNCNLYKRLIMTLLDFNAMDSKSNTINALL